MEIGELPDKEIRYRKERNGKEEREEPQNKGERTIHCNVVD